ncbi:MAG: cell division protein FtsW [Thalassobius sp.]|nr:cell division protein FtsW [Thalassovita sp.]
MQIEEHATGSIYRYLQGDKVIWAVSIILSLISILVVYSATGNLAFRSADGDTEHFLVKHTFLIILGFVAMFFAHRIDYRFYSRLSRYALLASIPLLIITWRFGENINDASRWIVIPFTSFSFQPSDFAKLALISNVASMLSKRQMRIRDDQKAINPMLIWSGIVCGLIGLTDWSSASILFLTILLLFFIGRVPVKYLGMMLVVGAMAGAFAFTFGQRKDTVSSRLSSFMNNKVSFQSEQAFLAVSTGGMFGKGSGNSDAKNFLPHPYSDFIFAIIVEEYGMLGAIVIIAAFLIILYRGMLIVSNSQRAFGGLLAAGLTFSLVLQAFIHMGVVVGVLPTTGLPLPLLSMGGTSLLFTGMSIGMLLSVSRTEELGEDDSLRRNLKRREISRNNAM